MLHAIFLGFLSSYGDEVVARAGGKWRFYSRPSVLGRKEDKVGYLEVVV